MTTFLIVRIALSALAATLAAVAAERGLRHAGRPARAVWGLALLLTATTSVLVVTGGRLPLGWPEAVSSWLTPSTVSVESVRAYEAPGAASPNALPLLWPASTLLLVLLFAAAFARQRRGLRAARYDRVGGVEVVVTDTLGPAVFGFLHPRIVVPEWLLERSESERRLVVEHEAEHIDARDPLLAAAALAVVCLVPWNPVLWYQLRRLRLAIELDCDARVLRRGDARAYGRLLIDVADRLARGTPLATALAFPRNFLNRRIRMIVNRRIRPLRAAVWGAAAIGLLVVACADAGDPLASDVSASPAPAEAPTGTFEFVARMNDGESAEVALAPIPSHEVPPRAEGPNVLMQRTPGGEWRIQVDSLNPTPLREAVRFRSASPEGHDADAERFTAERVPLRALEPRPTERE